MNTIRKDSVTLPEAALIAALREHGPTLGNDALVRLLPWRDHPVVGYRSDRERLHQFLRVALCRARRAGFLVRATGGDPAAGLTATGWVSLDGELPDAAITGISDVDAVHAALVGSGEVSARDLGGQVDAGWEQFVLTAPVGVAAFDLDPDWVETGRCLTMRMPVGSEDADRLALVVAQTVREVVAMRGVEIGYRDPDREGWVPVSSDPRRSLGSYTSAGRYRMRTGQ